MSLFRRLGLFSRKRRQSSLGGEEASTGSGEGNVSDLETSSHSSGEEDSSSDDEYDRPPSIQVPAQEGPTWLTVDDGNGGIKNICVSKAPDSQLDVGMQLSLSSAASSGTVFPLMPPRNNTRKVSWQDNSEQNSKQSPPPSSGAAPSAAPIPGIGGLLKQEFRDRNPFHFLIEPPPTEKLRKRIVSKKGVVHISKSHIGNRERTKLLKDFFNTMLDLQWRYVLVLFCLSFFLSWLAFAIVWYLILLIRGDFEPDHLPSLQEKNDWMPCVYAIHNFASCFLFSLETQHTIGYGSRQTTERCPEAILVMSFQSVVGVMIQACMVGTVFAKLTRPKKRAQTLLFSRNAVISKRDGHLCLCFRVANMRSSHLVECHTRAILVSKKITEEGEIIPFNQTELKVGTDMEGEEETIFFIWPTTIIHRINEESPFYNMSARDFVNKRFELIVVLEGIVEPTGMSIQARTSYLPNEILWGYRFVNVLNYRRREGQYNIDYGAFNRLMEVDETPTCSAKCLGEFPGLDHSKPGHHHQHRKQAAAAVKAAAAEAEAAAAKASSEDNFGAADEEIHFFSSHRSTPRARSRASITQSTPVIML